MASFVFNLYFSVLFANGVFSVSVFIGVFHLLSRENNNCDHKYCMPKDQKCFVGGKVWKSWEKTFFPRVTEKERRKD